MKLVICVQLAYVSVCLTQLSVVREWTSLDLQLISADGKESRRPIMPSDVKSWLMYKDRMFVTLQSRKPYSLAYLDLTDNSTSPLLRPYLNEQMKIYDLVKVRVDQCDRLWALSVMKGSKKHNIIIVIDLKTDSILRNIDIPNLRYSYDIAVDAFNCTNEYVYISSNVAVWTYSWADKVSWRHISGPIGSMILAPNSNVYYNSLGSEPMVYYMSTTHLKDKSNTSDITELGRNRKLNLASSALDAESDVLYYFNNDHIIHAVRCWTSERCSSNCQDLSIDPTHELMYITLDNGYLRAVTRKLSFKNGEINFRLLSVPVKSICIESNVTTTTTTTTHTSTDVEPNANYTTNTSTDVEPNANYTTNTPNITESTTPASSAADGRTIFCQILLLPIFLITILTKV